MKTLIYQNGERVTTGHEGDHTKVRALLNQLNLTVDNFGPLLSKETATTFIDTEGLEKRIVGDYELFMQPSKGFSLSPDFSKTKELVGVTVFYQKQKQ